jgi:hypothetical protein
MQNYPHILSIAVLTVVALYRNANFGRKSGHSAAVRERIPPLP